MNKPDGKTMELGLYIHIPFCAQICHYCDFAKSSHFDKTHVQLYMLRIKRDLLYFVTQLSEPLRFSSVFFGGGTPGLLTYELTELMEAISPFLMTGAEVTLEANPQNVTADHCRIWFAMGFNRLSIGVQSFDDLGLKTLTRNHSAVDGFRALETAVAFFSKTNGDLIYGWPGQSIPSWHADLERMVRSGVNHISAYALTYEGATPMARAQRRGMHLAMADDDVADRFAVIDVVLEEAGFDHEEVSNWSKAGGSCDHNWLYWKNQYYLGLGAGAHGFLPDAKREQSLVGLRYSFPSDFRAFLRRNEDCPDDDSIASLIQGTGGVIEPNRDLMGWLTEYVGTALRTNRGLDLDFLQGIGFKLDPLPILDQAIKENLILIKSNQLQLNKREWFRETSWSRILLDSFRRQ